MEFQIHSLKMQYIEIVLFAGIDMLLSLQETMSFIFFIFFLHFYIKRKRLSPKMGIHV